MSDALTIIDVSREIGVNEKTVRRWVKSGELHATRDILGRYQITRADLDDFIRRREAKYNQDSSDEDEDEE